MVWWTAETRPERSAAARTGTGAVTSGRSCGAALVTATFSGALAERRRVASPSGTGGTAGWLGRLDRARHRIPFWWWLTYDALVGLVIVAGIRPSDPAYWLGLGVLAIAVAIDAVEFIVKRPSARRKLDV